MLKSKAAVVPISGGMDSTVLLHHAARQHNHIHAVSFNYGQRHEKELVCASTQVQDIISKYGADKITHKVIDIPFFRDIAGTSALTNSGIDVAKARDVMGDPQTVNYVPFRNLMLISIACAYAEATDATVVYHGAAQADSVAGFWDGSEEFLDEINRVTALNRRSRIAVEAPLIKLSKAEIIALGNELDVDFSNTWTCYEGKDEPCGECTACALRIKGFIDAGIRDPLNYSKTIPWENLI